MIGHAKQTNRNYNFINIVLYTMFISIQGVQGVLKVKGMGLSYIFSSTTVKIHKTYITCVNIVDIPINYLSI